MMKNVYKNFLKYWWLGIIIIYVFAVIMKRIPDSDTFFLAATGRYIVENGVVPQINPFVIHQDFAIIIQQWLFDVLMYIIYGSWGNIGLFCYLILTYSISMILLYKYFSLFTNNKTHKFILLSVMGILYTAWSVARPTSISFIIMLSLLYCMEQYRSTKKYRYLSVLPILSLLQVNIHSSMWPMMFVLMVPYIFPYVLPRKNNIKNNCIKWFEKNRCILLTILIMFGVGFINPNGFNGILYVLKSYGSATGGMPISELQPPTTNTIYGIVVMIAVAALSLYVYQNKDKWNNPDYDAQTEFTRIYMTVGVLILACTHLRNLWFLILGATPTILIVMKSIQSKTTKDEQKIKYPILKGTLYLCILTIVGAMFLSNASYSPTTNSDSKITPIQAVEYLNETDKEDVVLYTEFENGAFMEWHGFKVYMDARPELYQKNINGKEDIYQKYCDVKQGNIDYAEFLNKYKFTHLIVIDNTLLDMYLSLNENYKTVVDGNGYNLYEHINNNERKEV